MGRFLTAWALLFTALPLGATGLMAAPASAQTPGSGCRAFAETRQQVCGRFLTYWMNHGDLPQQGYPISAEFPETSETDGKTYTVQYFERAVFEYHPEKVGTPYEVMLSLLGTFAFKRKYPH